MTLRELGKKDVIRTETGENLGRIDDLRFDEKNGTLQAVILRGRLRWFGLFGREEDLVLPWSSLKSIGADVVMVEHDAQK